MTLVVTCPEEASDLGAGGNWSSVTGTITIDTGVVLAPNTKSYKFTATGANSPFFLRTAGASKTYAGVRSFFRLDNVAPITRWKILQLSCGGNQPDVRITSGGVLQVSFSGGAVVSGPTLSANTWYGVEAEADIHANPRIIQWRTWAAGSWTGQTNASSGEVVGTFTDYRLGNPDGPSANNLYTTATEVWEGTATEYGNHTSDACVVAAGVPYYRPMPQLIAQ